MLQHSASLPAWLQQDMEQVNALIRRQLDSDVVLIRQVVEFILHGNERVRPGLVLAAARALGQAGDRQYALAAAVELIHVSLALHDGVTEASGGGADAHSEGALFGNAGNILLGDLLYTGAFRMIVNLNDMEVMRVLSDATNVIAEGEVLYRVARAAPVRDAARYLDMVSRRRAKLFEAGAACMAILHGAAPEVRAAFARFGGHVGMAHALRTEAEDAVKHGIDDAGADVARQLEAARTAIAALDAGSVPALERLAVFA